MSEVLVKPIEMEDIAHCLRVQLTMQRMALHIARLERHATGRVQFSDMVGFSASLKHTISHAQALSAQKVVLIEGESGTGKTMLAEAMHAHVREGQDFRVIDCEQWVSNHQDLPFETMSVGTLFLREVGFLDKMQQQQLLERLNVEHSLHFIVSSSAPLSTLVHDGLFAAELYAQLQQHVVSVPSLNDRREDIAQLAHYFLAMHTARNNKFIDRFSEDAFRALANSDWPGNVVQLSTLVYRCSMMCNHDVIDVGTLRLVQQLEPVHYARQAQILTGEMPSLLDAQGKIKKLRNIEDEAIEYALHHYEGSMTKAAASLGIGRSTLYRRIMGKKPQTLRPNQTTRPIMRMSSTDFS